MKVDFLIAGFYPGNGEPGPIAFPDPDAVAKSIKGIRYVNLAALIQLKLAARRHYDFGDVEHLIRVHDLDETYVDHLHPSIHRDFIECLEEKRREDAYEARQDEKLSDAIKPRAAKRRKYPEN